MTKVIVDLEKPCGGWSFLSLEDEKDSGRVVISYIDGNVALHMLKKFYKYLTFGSTHILLEFDGESVGDQLVMVTGQSCCVWENAYTAQGKTFNISTEDFIEQVLNAICENFVSWSAFDIFVITDEEYEVELEKNKKILTKWIKKVRRELVIYRNTFNGL